MNRLKHIKTRSFCAQTATPTSDSSAELLTRSFTEERPRKCEVKTIAGHLESRPASCFTGLLSSTHFASTCRPNRQTSDELKQEFKRLLKAGQYHTILRTLETWTASTAVKSFKDLLSPEEFSYIMSELVLFHQGLQSKCALKGVLSSKAGLAADMNEAANCRESIRRIYSNLLFDGDAEQHIYSKSKRNSLGETYYSLSMKDYENLIVLEINSGKLDLASKWFQRIEQRYPNDSHYLKMTYNLWLLRFHVYSGGVPNNWEVKPTGINSTKKDPKRSVFRSGTRWVELFDEFSRNQLMILGNLQFLFDKSTVMTVVNSIAHSRDLNQLYRVIEEIWGINSEGSLCKGFRKPKSDDPCFPDIDIVKTVVIALIYNNQPVGGMKIVNAFQEHYDVDLRRNSKHFWDQLFRWSELTTRYSEFMALQYFIRSTKADIDGKFFDKNRFYSLEQAQKSPDFDYEGYLTFIADLQNQRARLVKELWTCYKASGTGFYPRVYLTYLTVLEESKDEKKIYGFLSEVAQELHLHLMHRDSYNYALTRKKVNELRKIYRRAATSIIEMKGMAGELEAIDFVIQKWALDGDMKQSLERYASKNESRYQKLKKEREEVDLRQQEAEEEEKFLGLMV